MSKSRHVTEYGDFQTPLELACEVVVHGISSLSKYKTVIEPNCGRGSFLQAVVQNTNHARNLIGWDVNPDYINETKTLLKDGNINNIIIEQQDFFQIDWYSLHSRVEEPILFLGNPPWVTNSELGKIHGSNLPKKANFNNLSGMDAMTGKSNFDISEWMMIQVARFIEKTESTMAFLIKTSVARKVFVYICKNRMSIDNITIKHIDAKAYFDVNVDACLFYAEGCRTESTPCCRVYRSLNDNSLDRTMGYEHNRLIANRDTYRALSAIDTGSPIRWRSGIKHDCAKVMELTFQNGYYVNGFGETVDIEEDYLFPMYKSSDIAKPVLPDCCKFMVVTQQYIDDPTDKIQNKSPQTWDYLNKYSSYFGSRKSSIYEKAERFSIFGVGDYTFLPWKVGISGLYKNCTFTFIGPQRGKPVVLDDTCYFLGFEKEKTAHFVWRLLSSDIAKQFIDSVVFKDDKRPVTAALLNRINLEELAKMTGMHDQFHEMFFVDNHQQQLLCLDH